MSKTLTEEMDVLGQKIADMLGNSQIEVFEYYAKGEDEKTSVFWRDSNKFEHYLEYGWNEELRNDHDKIGGT